MENQKFGSLTTFELAQLYKALRKGNYKAVEPLTIIQGVAAVIGIFSSLKKMSDSNDTKDYLSKINKKLNRLLLGQATILAELKAMRIHFREDVRSEFLSAVEAELTAELSWLDIYLLSYEDRSAAENIKDLEEHAADVHQIGFRLATYGLASFHAVVIALATTETMYRLALKVAGSSGRAPLISRWKAIHLEFKERFKTWLSSDGDTTTSIVLSIQQSEADAKNFLTHINQYTLPYRVKIGTRSESRREGNWSYYTEIKQYADITGSLEDGFKDVLYEKVGKHRRTYEGGNHDRYKRFGVSSDIIDDPSSAVKLEQESIIASQLSVDASIAKLLSTPVNHAITKALNQYRKQYFALTKHIAEKQQIEKLLKVLVERDDLDDLPEIFPASE